MNPLAIGPLLLTLLDILIWLIIGRCLLSYFPALDWRRQPWATLHALTEPIMSPFRRILPIVGGFDLSPVLLLVSLQIVRSILATLLASAF